ncbi:MAG: thiol-disulfide oxidoreductase [Flavobacteriales bacterium]|mgnify:FL=1|jgi:predicted DCC family thiol-disulfide oxidoreductase YuxK|nr:thiol-disulfide oxidoreductase [Flavobacteriales bacterium]|tara:strand:- start:17432 stop:17866 length:435 start_codon:yes stop_codon:yes gene_type:complete
MSEDLKTKKIILFDGICTLCNNFIVFIAKNDKKDIFRFLPLQNKNINQFINTKNINIKDLKSIVLIEDKNPKYKSNAAIEILINLNKIFLLCTVFYIIPRIIRDMIYNLIAKNRYKIFGRVENCSILKSKMNSEILKKKIISDS